MIDLGTLVSAMTITWIHRLYNNHEAPWVKVAKLYLGSIKKIILLRSSYCQNIPRKIKKKIGLKFCIVGVILSKIFQLNV